MTRRLSARFTPVVVGLLAIAGPVACTDDVAHRSPCETAWRSIDRTLAAARRDRGSRPPASANPALEKCAAEDYQRQLDRRWAKVNLDSGWLMWLTPDIGCTQLPAERAKRAAACPHDSTNSTPPTSTG